MRKAYLSLIIIFLGLIFLVLWLVFQPSFLPPSSMTSPMAKAQLKINQTVLRVELADTPTKRAKGLSQREGMVENQGMLFIFEQPGRHSFWMKGMNFPLDIIWFNEEDGIVDIVKDIQPDSFPQTFKPRVPSQYVLEVNAGFVEKNQIKIGDPVTLRED